MRLRVTLRDPSGSPRAPGETDLVITTDAATPVGDVARGIVRSDPRRPIVDDVTRSRLTLSVAGAGDARSRIVPPDRPVGEAAIANGATVHVVADAATASSTGSTPASTAVLRAVDGPGAGHEWSLPPGDATIGRDPSCRIVLDDPMVSSRHARVSVGERVEIVDLNSANGVLIDGEAVARATLGPGVRVVLGQTVLEVETLAAGAVRRESGSPVVVLRSPRVSPRFAARTIEPPSVPTEKDAPRFPWISLVAPVVMGLAMFAFTRQPFSLLFVAMAPIMMLGSWWDGRSQRKKQMRDEAIEFEQRLGDLQTELRDLREVERATRLDEVPSASTVLGDVLRGGDLTWVRRPEHWNTQHVRLGVGTVRSRVDVPTREGSGRVLPDPAARLKGLVEHFATIDGVPIVESLADAGNLAVCGPRDTVAGVARGLLVQLAGLHAPAELELAAIVGPEWSGELAALAWLPHANDTATLGDAHLADSPVTGARVLGELEALLVARTADRESLGALADDKAADAHGSAVEHAPVVSTPMPTVVVVVTDDAPVDAARLIDLAERGPKVGVHVLWLASDRAAVPGACRTVVDATDAGEPGRASIGRVRLGETVTAAIETVSAEQLLTVAMRLAATVDAGTRGVESSDLPRSVSLVSLLGTDVADSPAGVVERWRQTESIAQRGVATPVPPTRRGSLRAIVGSAGVDAMALDLRNDGPHALVGGTTGSGKSEFLQSWVLGMAAGYSPDRVTFLFVDYKGGSAFAECTSLPHCVGLVTDLSPKLVRRALTSLRAELHYRERLLRDLGAKDLAALEQRGDPAAPPSLVIVIDEFAALATDVPEFVDGVVDIAQRGRSLGIHLIMATQRPAGVIRDNLRANTNLRVALRMADAHDSQDVVGENTAATFDPSLPGRGVVKRGPGRLTPFQSAYAGGRTPTDGRASASGDVRVAAFRFGVETPWEPPAAPAGSGVKGPSDIVRMVATIDAAATAARIPAPRRPWLDELPASVALEDLAPRRDDALVIGLADDPAHQSRETIAFRPDSAGHLGVYGTGGSGKSTVLRTIAAGAGITPDGGPVDVYAIDMAGGGLRMLRQLPHVSSVVPGDDIERVTRLMRVLRDVLEDRSRRFPEVSAATLTEYRALSGEAATPRILLLLDGYPSFRDEYEGPLSGGAYGTLLRLLQEGRQVGMHVVLTADRSGSVPTAVSSALQQRVVLRQADDTGYQLLDVPRDLLGEKSPPGRAIVGDLETHVAVLGGSANPAEQSTALGELADAQRRCSGRTEWPEPVLALPAEVAQAELPDEVGGRPVLGLAEDTLAPLGFEASGVLLVAGPPASGRTNTLLAIAEAVRRWDPSVERHLLCPPRSSLIGQHAWTSVSSGVDEVGARARELSALVTGKPAGVGAGLAGGLSIAGGLFGSAGPAVSADAEAEASGDDDAESGAATEGDDAEVEVPRVLVVLEEIGDWLQTAADLPLVELIKAIRRSEHLFVADGDTSSWVSAWPLMSEIKSARRGVLLQPEPVDGETILRTVIPRGSKVAPPPGRAVAVLDRRAVRVQVPLATVSAPAAVPVAAPMVEAAAGGV